MKYCSDGKFGNGKVDSPREQEPYLVTYNELNLLS